MMCIARIVRCASYVQQLQQLQLQLVRIGSEREHRCSSAVSSARRRGSCDLDLEQQGIWASIKNQRGAWHLTRVLRWRCAFFGKESGTDHTFEEARSGRRPARGRGKRPRFPGFRDPPRGCLGGGGKALHLFQSPCWWGWWNVQDGGGEICAAAVVLLV
jgi:hypothetical protein